MRNLASILMFCLLFPTMAVVSQEIDDFKTIDSLSYHYYLDKNWKNLIQLSKSAIRNDIDYYYLRMRTGIAYYEKGNFLRAQKNFNKALHYNSLDPAPVDYLFYTSLFLGDLDMAKFTYHKLNVQTEPLTQARLKPVSSISLISSYLTNSDPHSIEKMISGTPLSSDGYQFVTQSFLYNSILLKHDLNPTLYFTHAVGILNKNNYYINSSQGLLYESSENKSTQYQYYASLKFIPAQNISFTAGFHYLNFSMNDLVYRERVSGLGYTVPGIKQNNFVGDVSLFKSVWLVRAGAGITFANLNDQKQIQQNFTLAFYPLGNLNLYLVSKLNLINEKTVANETDRSVIQRHSLGFKAFKHLWLEGTAWIGQFKNASLNEGFLIMNSNEPITSKYDFSLIVPFDKFQINLLLSKTNFYTSLFTFAGISTEINKTSFHSANALISIKWNI